MGYRNGGVKFYSDFQDKRNSFFETFNFGDYEIDISEILFALAQKESTIFDIGANIGWFTNHFASMFPTSKIYAFEPMPEIYLQLEKILY